MLAVARHLADYATWRSLAVDQGLGERERVDVAVRLSWRSPTVVPATRRPRRLALVC